MWQERENSSVGYNEEMFGEPSSPVQQEPEQEPPRPRAAAGDAQALLAASWLPASGCSGPEAPKSCMGPGARASCSRCFSWVLPASGS